MLQIILIIAAIVFFVSYLFIGLLCLRASQIGQAFGSAICQGIAMVTGIKTPEPKKPHWTRNIWEILTWPKIYWAKI